MRERDRNDKYVKTFDQAAAQRKGGKTVFFKASTKDSFSISLAKKFGFSDDELP